MPADVDSLKAEISGIRQEVNAMSSGIARHQGEVLTEIKHLSHDMKNMLQTQAAFVPRREIEEHFERRDEARKSLAERVVALEAGKADAETVKHLAEFKEKVLLWFAAYGLAGMVVAGVSVKALVGSH